MNELTAKILISFLLICISTACFEVDMSTFTNGENPPTFKLSGSGGLHFFLVMEVPPENQTQTIQRSSDGNIVLWKILPDSKHNLIRNLPPITYGQVPPGFTQVIPSEGHPPPQLIEGKIYEVGGPAYNANGGFIWIEVRNGKVVEIPIPGSR